MKNISLTVVPCGTISYQEGLDLQAQARSLLIKKTTQPPQGIILICEHHPPIITTGKNAPLDSLLLSVEELAKKGIDFLRTTRGGNVTYHGKGQLVIYPIISLKDLSFGVKEYVYSLQEALICALKHFAITAYHDSQYPGVWVKDRKEVQSFKKIKHRKIAAVGLAIKRGISCHGMAINIDLDTTPYSYIIPCGIQQDSSRGITTLKEEINISSSHSSQRAQALQVSNTKELSSQLCKHVFAHLETQWQAEVTHIIDKDQLSLKH
ncbi:MAG: lipoyl(octanoyl) transferase LipB [Proteobacteria bacterium]|nr:lipoyl(octanoyl) transferase LipB [Pseudomonadota bacterium]